MGHIDYQNTYDFVCIFAIFSNLFGVVMAGCVLMEVTRRSNKPASVKGSMRSLYGGSYSQCQCCGSFRTLIQRYRV